jgi:phosphoglycolate phosphatase-like HAD superfamily hydrolase
MNFIGVTSGYNKKQVLLQHGARYVLKSASELVKILN